MFIVLTIFLQLLIPLAMAVFFLVRPRFSIQGFLVVVAVLAGWVMVLLARWDLPATVTWLNWEPASFFPNSPTLLIDGISWSFSIGLMSLTVALTITSIAQLGQSYKISGSKEGSKIEDVQPQGLPESGTSGGERVPIEESGLLTNWPSWAGTLILTSFGLVAVTAGNMLTLLIGWAALDVTELIILLSQVLESRSRERIVLAFTSRMAGIAMALLAGIIPWSQGITLSFDSINQSTSIFLILAAGLRLGVLPIHLPLIRDIPLRRGMGTVLRLVPAAASFILLVRVANIGVLGPATPYLLVFTALAGLYAGINWLNSTDELSGRPFWLLGTASLAVAAAILNRPMACITWSIASILSGGLTFSMSIRHKNLFPIVALGLINFSAIPFSATWLGTGLYSYTEALTGIVAVPIFYLFSFGFLLIHALLLTGMGRNLIRGNYPSEGKTSEHIERWVWFLYPIGLFLIIVTHFLIGFLFQPEINGIPISGWIMGSVTILFSIAIWYAQQRLANRTQPTLQVKRTSPANVIFSLEWLYRLLWWSFRLLARFTSLISTILEGDGGILWALVLFALIFVFLQR